jgi:hypothetical protein
MSDIPDRSRAEIQRDIAVAALEAIVRGIDRQMRQDTELPQCVHAVLAGYPCGQCATVSARKALAKIAEIEKAAPPPVPNVGEGEP